MIMAFIINPLAEYSLFLFYYRTNVPINPLLFFPIRKTPASWQEFKIQLLNRPFHQHAGMGQAAAESVQQQLITGFDAAVFHAFGKR